MLNQVSGIIALALVASSKHQHWRHDSCDDEYDDDARKFMIGVSAAAFSISLILFSINAFGLGSKIASEKVWRVIVSRENLVVLTHIVLTYPW